MQGVAVADSGDETPPAAVKQKKGKKSSKGGARQADEADPRSAAELELLLMDDAALTHMAKTGTMR